MRASQDVPGGSGSELAVRLERTFRFLGKRVYAPSFRTLRADNQGLDSGSFPVLAALEASDDLRPSDIAALVELDLSTVSRHLRQLEHLNLLSRRPDDDDKRAHRVRLTEYGRDNLRRLRAARAAVLDEVFRDWDAADQEQLLLLLDRLLAGLGPAPGSSCGQTEEGDR